MILFSETTLTPKICYLMGGCLALTTLSPISMISMWPARDQVIFKIFVAGNLLKALDFKIGHLIAQVNPIAMPYLYTLAFYSIYSDPTYGLKAQASKIQYLIRSFNFTDTTKPIQLTPPALYSSPIVNPCPQTRALDEQPVPKPTLYSGPIVNPFIQICGLDEQPIPKPKLYSGPIVNPFIQICGLDEQPVPKPKLYSGPIVNPFIQICGLDEQPIPAQSSTLLPILGAVVVAGVVGYLAYKYYQSRKVEPIQKQPEPTPVVVTVPIKPVTIVTPPKIEEPQPEIDPELKEIADAAASFTDTTQSLAKRYIFSAAKFGKGFLFNIARSIKYIALTILSVPLLITDWGRTYFKSKCVRILPSLRNILISAMGIPSPHSAIKLQKYFISP